MRSSTVIVIFAVFFLIWLVNTKRLARIVDLYRNGSGTTSNIIDPETGGPVNAGTPPISGSIGPKPPKFDEELKKARKNRVERIRETNPNYLPSVIP
jgi:hypothetical protein